MAKLVENMDIYDVVMTMSEGNPGTLKVVMHMMSDLDNLVNLFICDYFDIRGSKLYKLHNDCCQRRDDKFDRTLMMIKGGVFSLDEIHSNLDLVKSIPFIDDSIVIDGVLAYGEKFGFGDDKWKEFCQKNREVFVKKLNTALEEQNVKKKNKKHS